MKTYTVTIELEAQNKNQIERWLDRMGESLMIYDTEIVSDDDRHYEERIRYDEDWNGQGEHFVFEGKWSDETEWGLDSAFQLFDYDKDGYHEGACLINYRALTKIRELKKMGIDFWFSSK